MIPVNPLPFSQTFSNSLGSSTTIHAFPPVTRPPGIGNINQPGLLPGAPTVIPNINNPAGPLLEQHPFARRGYSFHPGASNGPIIYVVPSFGYYGVPEPYYYYGYPEAPPAPPPAEQPPAPESATPPGELYYVPPESTGQAVEQPPAESQAIPVPQQQQTKPVTLLAFKDQTVVAVTDYWLKGETLYYQTSYGQQTGVPFDQLDLTLTQQLNSERNVPFVLEARP